MWNYPKFEPEFTLFKIKVEDYKTEIENCYPVVRLFFSYENDSGNQKVVSFYITDSKMIDELIDSLLSVKIKLNEIINSSLKL